MNTTQQQDSVQAKQRLRNEISNHVQEFLHKGGRIEVATDRGSHLARIGSRTATAELGLISGLFDE